jgi:drug/metabolite transporter (DMT)-like permease
MIRSLDRFGATLIFVLCVVWGFNQVIVKLALPEVGPIAQTGIRSAIGAVCVAAYALAAKRRIFRIDGTEIAGAIVGVLFTVEFVTLYESLRWTTVARATVFIYSAPFFVALGAAFLLKEERLSARQWVGLALAFLGMATGLAGRGSGGGSGFGDALALIAAVFWAATTVMIKATSLRHADPVKVLLYQISIASLLAAPTVWASGERAPSHVSAVTVAALLWQGVAVVGVSYALWFRALTRYPAAELSAFTFITPLVGVVGGALVFGERITPGFAAAIALVLAGLSLITWPRRARPTSTA